MSPSSVTTKPVPAVSPSESRIRTMLGLRSIAIPLLAVSCLGPLQHDGVVRLRPYLAHRHVSSFPDHPRPEGDLHLHRLCFLGQILCGLHEGANVLLHRVL